jgi:uncharacterized membrane protein YdbT with pleckstrin-like domain
MFDPNVDQYLTLRGGEQKVLEVPKHWMALVWPGLRMCTGVSLCTWASWKLDGFWYWVVMFIGWVAVVEAMWRHVAVFRDRFVITTTRVFRFTGVWSTQRASVPIGRFTDSTVKKSWLGQLFGYGHFRFETAGQKQDLERVRFIRDIDRVAEILQIITTKKAMDQAWEQWTEDEIRAVLDGT